MPVTFSRLYDSYGDAQQAVTNLEAAGVPHSDLSIVANNSDNWYGTDNKVDRDRDGVDDRAEGLRQEPGSVPASGEPQVCWLASVYSPFPALAR